MSERGDAGWRKHAKALIAVFIVALALRVAYVLHGGLNLPPDTDSYVRIADNLSSSAGYSLIPGIPTAYRPPAYPVFILLVKILFGDNWAVIWAQCLLGALVPVLTAVLSKRVIGGAYALAAAWIVALDPYLIAVSDAFMTEALFAFLVTAFFAALLRAFETPGLIPCAIAGAIGGLACLTRPELLVFMLIAIAGLLALGRRRIPRTLVFVFFAAAICSAWVIRNSVSMGSAIFTTTHGGYTHRLAYNAVFYDRVVAGGREVWDSSNESLSRWRALVDEETQDMNEVARDRQNYRMAQGFLLADPARAGSIALHGVRGFWRPYPHGTGFMTNVVLGGFFVLLAASAALGCVALLRRGPFAWLVVCLLVAETILHMYYWSNIRMRVPFQPLMAVAAASAPLFFRRPPGSSSKSPAAPR